MASYPLRFPIEAGNPAPINNIADAVRKTNEQVKLSASQLQIWGKAVQAEIDHGYSFAKAISNVNASFKAFIPNMDAFTERLKLNVREQQRAEQQAKATEAAMSRMALLMGARGVGLPMPFGAYGALGSITNRMGPATTGGLIAAAGVAGVDTAALDIVKKLTEHAAEYAKEMTNLSAKTGLALRDTQLFARASEVAGVNVTSLVAQVRTLSKAMAENSEEGRRAKQALKELGLDQSVAYQSPGAAIQAIYGKIAQVPSSFDRERIASTLFGRGGLEALPLAGQLGTLSSRLEGTILSDSEIAKANKLRQEFKLLEAGIDSLALHIGVNLMSAIDRLLGTGSTGQRAGIAVSTVGGGLAGSLAGGFAGAVYGAGAGATLMGVGAIPGTIIGGISGAFLGGAGGAGVGYGGARGLMYLGTTYPVPTVPRNGRGALNRALTHGSTFGTGDIMTAVAGSDQARAFDLYHISEQIQTILNAPGPGISGIEKSMSKRMKDAETDMMAAADRRDIPGTRAARAKLDEIQSEMAAMRQTVALRQQLSAAQAKELTGIGEINAAHERLIQHMKDEGSYSTANLKLAQQIRDAEIQQFRQREKVEQTLNSRQVATALFNANRGLQSSAGQSAYRLAIAQGRYEDTPAAIRAGIAAGYGITMQSADAEFALASREVQDLRIASAARESVRHDSIQLSKEQAAIREAQIRASATYAGTIQRAGTDRDISGIEEDRREKTAREAADREIRNANVGLERDLLSQRASASSRFARYGSGGAGGGLAPTAAESITITYNQRLRFAQEGATIELRAAQELQKTDEKRVAINKAIVDLRKAAGEAELEREDKIAELRQRTYEQDKERVQSLARGGFEALTSGGGGLALGRYLRSKLIGFGGSIAGNLAGIGFDSFMPNLHTSATFAKQHPVLSRALHGTAFESDPSGGLQVAGNRLTSAAGTLDAAGQALMAAAFKAAGLPVPAGMIATAASPGGTSAAGLYTPVPPSYTPVGGDGAYTAPATPASIASMTGIAVPMGMSGGAIMVPTGPGGGIANASGSSLESTANHVADIAARATNLVASRNPKAIEGAASSAAQAVGKLFKNPSIAKDIAGATAIAGGGLTAYEGFHMGGAQGALEGSSGIAGAAAGALMLAGVSGPAAPIMAALAGGLGLASAIMGDPRARRAHRIDKTMRTYSFYTPAALNVSTSIGGNATAYDRSGQLRDIAGLNPYPTVQEPYMYRSVMVPGRTTSTVGAAGPGTTVNINAMDSQSFSDYLMNNADPVAAAAVASLNQSGGQGLVELMRSMGAGG